MSRQSRKLAAQRLKETVDYLWSCYRHDRGNVEMRNRLAEHYTPLAQEIAQRCIRHYRIREIDAAMGDALLLLVLRIIPRYDSARSFRGWAAHCIRQKLLERRRLERQHYKRFRENFGKESDWPEIENLLVRPAEPGADARFAELTAALPSRSAALLWLRFHRHLSHRAIGQVFGIPRKAIAKQICRAIGVLQKFAGLPPRADAADQDDEFDDEFDDELDDKLDDEQTADKALETEEADLSDDSDCTVAELSVAH